MKDLGTLVRSPVVAAAVGAVSLFASAPSFAEVTGNVSVTNNYIWRGLTQSINEAAVQGGLDYASDSGFYAGTWVSNVAYDSDDAYSYEHDLYAGFSGEAGALSYDFGYLYYNYDKNAEFDFGEVYASFGVGVFSFTAYVLANTEAEEGVGQDFGFGSTYYTSFDFAFPLANDVELSLHVGYHDGDFAEAFNGVTDAYLDYNITIAKGGFAFMVTQTSLSDDDDGDGVEDYASMAPRDNDEIKFVVSYSMDFDLM